MVPSSPLGLHTMTNTCMSAIRAFMLSMPWQCAMHNFRSLTLCVNGRDQFMIQQYSMAAWSMHTLKMAVDKIAATTFKMDETLSLEMSFPLELLKKLKKKKEISLPTPHYPFKVVA